MTPILTPHQMQAVDRATIDAGIPGIILMENAASAVVDYLREKFSPLAAQRIVVVCGKGNNGGDGLAIARQLHVRFAPRELRVILTCAPEQLTGDAALNLSMLHAAGLQTSHEIGPELHNATLVIDAVLGTGLSGAARGEALDAIRSLNGYFPHAKVVAVDIPSGLSGASATPPGAYVRADATVTFTAPKLCHVLSPACELMGDLRLAGIGTPDALIESTIAPDGSRLSLVGPKDIRKLFAPRVADSNKGMYGHVLVVAGSRGKSGAAAMSSLAALRAGAGLVTVACPDSVLDAVAAHAPEVMTEPLRETGDYDRIMELASHRTLVAIGPGMGTVDETRATVRRLFAEVQKPMVVDADALNCIAGSDWRGPEWPRILTPHPGEMARLAETSVAAIQADRIGAARGLATKRGVIVVLKGNRTLIAFPDGGVWVNPTGSPSMATGGTGDILTGVVAGMAAQFPGDLPHATAAAIYLHGLAGQIAARHLTEQTVIASDLLQYLPEGIRAITDVSHPHSR